jgi:hypothetical protein
MDPCRKRDVWFCEKMEIPQECVFLRDLCFFLKICDRMNKTAWRQQL